MTGQIPDSLGSLKNLKVLFLNQNALTGPIPISLTSLDLVELNLADNQLAGEIPQNISSMINLESLYLNSNVALSSTIPDLSKLSKLYALSLHHCGIKGGLENAKLGLISQNRLTLLYLDGNSLTDSVPNSWQYLNNLQILHLNDNSLDGELPWELNSLSNLAEL